MQFLIFLFKGIATYCIQSLTVLREVYVHDYDSTIDKT